MGGVVAGQVDRPVDWYGQVAESVYTARKGLCNCWVKNALLYGQNRLGREKWGECREKLRGGGYRKDDRGQRKKQKW